MCTPPSSISTFRSSLASKSMGDRSLGSTSSVASRGRPSVQYAQTWFAIFWWLWCEANKRSLTEVAGISQSLRVLLQKLSEYVPKRSVLYHYGPNNCLRWQKNGYRYPFASSNSIITWACFDATAAARLPGSESGNIWIEIPKVLEACRILLNCENISVATTRLIDNSLIKCVVED